MTRIFIALILTFSSGIAALAQQPKDSTAYFKKLADDYRKMGLPEASVPIMVQMERERLYPEIKRKADQKRNEEGRRRAKQFTDDDEDDAEAQKMMDAAIRKMGKDPAEVNKKMAEAPKTNSGEIPKPSTKPVAVTPASEAALLAYLNAMLQKAEAALSPARKTKVTQYLGKGRETGYAGVAFWINKEHDVALYLMLKACVANPRDFVLLNNFAACLSMVGLPEKAIPILNYVSIKLPNNATVLNNMGQAWLSLGNVPKAKPLLEKAVTKENAHPEANRSLSKIASKESNKTKAAEYLGKAMSGGFDAESYNAWKKLSPGKDVATLIRANHKNHYKEVPITKRWILPEIPTNVAQAQEKEQAINQFFADIDATINNMSPKIEVIENAAQEKQNQKFLQMEQQVKSMNSLDDVQRYNNQFGNMFHPLKAQAQLMLTSIRSDDYATSYNKRIEQAERNREDRLAEFNNSLKSMYAQIDALKKSVAGLEGGENGDDELKIQAADKQACAINAQIQSLQLTSLAEINTQYMKQVENILNQRLQEEMYWTALFVLPNNTSGALYRLYEDYLTDLAKFKRLYPLPAPSLVYCNGESSQHKATSVKGKLQVWEDSHCPIDINVNIMVVQAQMNCHEIKLAAKISGVNVSWDRKIDVVTWETLEHSISIAGGLGEFETQLSDQIKGKVGVDGKVTVKLDGDLIPTDLIVKAEAGAEVSGPMGGKAGADLGSVEISIQSGLRGEGPVPDLVGKMFGN